MSGQKIAVSLVAFVLVSTFSLPALAGPAREPDRSGRAMSDDVARQARRVNLWLTDHPELAERIIRNFRQRRGQDVAAPAPRRPGRTAMMVRQGWGRGDSTGRRHRGMMHAPRPEMMRRQGPNRAGFMGRRHGGMKRPHGMRMDRPGAGYKPRGRGVCPCCGREMRRHERQMGHRGMMGRRRPEQMQRKRFERYFRQGGRPGPEVWGDSSQPKMRRFMQWRRRAGRRPAPQAGRSDARRRPEPEQARRLRSRRPEAAPMHRRRQIRPEMERPRQERRLHARREDPQSRITERIERLEAVVRRLAARIEGDRPRREARPRAGRREVERRRLREPGERGAKEPDQRRGNRRLEELEKRLERRARELDERAEKLERLQKELERRAERLEQIERRLKSIRRPRRREREED